ncbi:MAG: prepilin-type N-terminal cleavage/methylation domain-containing protein, partial [Candidatus Colwellbacteria bacterium]|nr:prepilin-type N-terminal cleavage/methylation domain-containing protein [Candidatus Colwellbacteria bacterium]
MFEGDNLSIKSFTLVELLIVIAILAVLAAAVVVVLNPAELLAQARDSQRSTDL